uniref:Protochlorophyllide reductase n=1 Tax=Chlamydomonas euryale TaxID=1486919 RepID=A0A7R9Z2B6_9CHLO|mmetsp:Transcript_40342/g.120315  ORF Transcript_40342/g.120315 Transcript_40342/m.120315 type:complete len:413 (+) Transcript_40342:97-1335(+)
MGPAPPAGDGVNATSLTVPLPGALQRLWLTMSTTLRAAIEMWTYNIGERLGQAWGRAAPQPRASLKGKVCIVTGAESGIGFATSHQLARMGAHVIIASRNTTRSMAAVEAISKSLQSSDVAASAAGDPAALPLGHAEFMELDLSSLKSVRSFAKKFNARGLPLHLLICNAGIMAPPARQASSDGLELQFQVNFLSHWLLTNMLLAEQRKAKRHTKTGQAEGSDDGDGHVAATLLQGGSRVVMLSSVLHRGGQLQYGDMQSERAYSPFASYAFSKLLNNVTAVELQRRINRNPIPGRSDSVVAVHPGIADTELSGGFFKSQGILWLWFLSLLLPLYNGLLAATKDVTLRTTNSAANTVLFASLAPSELVAGAYVVPDAAVTRHHRAAYDEDTAKQMWDYAAELTGLQIDPSLS